MAYLATGGCELIWDFINAVIRIGADAVHAVYSTLPASPIFLPSVTQAELAPIFAKVAWFFPISGMVAFLAIYLVAVFILAGVLLVKQFIEAVIP
jgi:hypothetical protein